MSSFASEVLARFESKTPLTVQSRALLEYAMSPDKVNALFRDAAVGQYERELLFSTTFDVMTDVVLGVRSSVRQSFLQKKEDKEISVSIASLYNKLRCTETTTSEALVRHSFEQLHPVVVAMKALSTPLLPGYQVKVIDGSCLAATEHRLAVLRTTSAGPLPGKGLVIFDMESRLLEDCLLTEDGHAQERSLFERWFDRVKARQLWIDDRNFCTTQALFAIHERGARFVTRQHATNAPWEAVGLSTVVGRVATGLVSEQTVRLLGQGTEGEPARELVVRRVTLTLDVPTRDGESVIHVLTDLTQDELDGCGVAELYRLRWTLETAFGHLTMDLNSEINTLGYPGAALFGLAVGILAYNMVSTMKASILAEHGEDAAENLSGYSIAQDIATTAEGMEVAIPPEAWAPMAAYTPQQMGDYLRVLARHVSLTRFAKTTRGPKKPAPPRTASRGTGHVSTAKLLAAAKPTTRKKSP